MATYLRKSGCARSSSAAAVLVDGDGVGFPPKRIEIVNETNGASLLWFESMGQDHALVMDAAGARTMLTADGVTTTYTGFQLAAGIADINDTDDELLSYFVTG